MFDAEQHRAKAREYSLRAKQERSADARERLLRMERSYLLLARNADWMKNTDAFLREPARKADEQGSSA